MNQLAQIWKNKQIEGEEFWGRDKFEMGMKIRWWRKRSHFKTENTILVDFPALYDENGEKISIKPASSVRNIK